MKLYLTGAGVLNLLMGSAKAVAKWGFGEKGSLTCKNIFIDVMSNTPLANDVVS